MTLTSREPTRVAVPPRPRRTAGLVTLVAVAVAVVALHGVGVHETEFSLPKLASGRHGIWAFFAGDSTTAGAYPPDLHWSVIRSGLAPCLVSFSMGLLGTTFSIPFAAGLGALGSRTTTHNAVVYQLARALMSFFRAMPIFVWGLIFVTAVGLGPFPGVLAIVVHNTGVMGKLWSEAMEETDQGPLEALRSAGANSLQTATHAVVPGVLPQFLSLYLYRLDVNVRDSLTLGVVGAGGIGFYITNTIHQFQFNQMLTYVLMMLVLIIAVDLLSAWLRQRVAA